jgi:hypothetical protein
LQPVLGDRALLGSVDRAPGTMVSPMGCLFSLALDDRSEMNGCTRWRVPRTRKVIHLSSRTAQAVRALGGPSGVIDAFASPRGPLVDCIPADLVKR